MAGDTAAPPAPMRSERRVTLGAFTGLSSAALTALCWGRRRRRRRRRWDRASRRRRNHRAVRAGLRRRRRWRERRRRWRRSRDPTAEIIPCGEPDRPRLSDIVAETRSQIAFTIDRELRIPVEQVLDPGDELDAAIPLQ